MGPFPGSFQFKERVIPCFTEGETEARGGRSLWQEVRGSINPQASCSATSGLKSSPVQLGILQRSSSYLCVLGGRDCLKDTAGQERYRTITTAYYRGAMGFLLMYDIANQDSFNAVQDWATQIKTYSWDNAQVILVGNKCDLEDDRVVATEDGKRLADELGFEFFEASAKDNINVKQVFERLVDIICEKMNESLDTNTTLVGNSKNGALTETPPPQSSSCSC
ncbi:ras-related protein Rab-3D isoform X1 [Gopherus flavomarginatus]|uniref:ras-related protein Rab-3D isoform X1 n=1 Tax=Gopherus flavomarginatus TaxID=286002 RepID=UPI0021CC2306|nr:ras-related protein Rab-3D isoform X1 [Gopherus flavomarginatus]